MFIHEIKSSTVLFYIYSAVYWEVIKLLSYPPNHILLVWLVRPNCKLKIDFAIAPLFFRLVTNSSPYAELEINLGERPKSPSVSRPEISVAW